MIAGIAIPNSGLAREATEFVRDVSTQLLFDHSRRVFLWASLQAEQLSLDYHAELLYVGARGVRAQPGAGPTRQGCVGRRVTVRSDRRRDVE